MDKSKIKKIFIYIVTIYTVLVVAFYYLAGDKLKYKESVGNRPMPEDADMITDEIVSGMTISQSFVNNTDNISEIAMVFHKFFRDGNGKVFIKLLDGNELLDTLVLDVKNDIPEQHRIYLTPNGQIKGMLNKELTIKITSTSKQGEGVAIMMKQDGYKDSIVNVDNKQIMGTLCFSITGEDKIYIGQYYWFIMAGVGLILAIALYRSYKDYLNDKANFIIAAILAVNRYKFLISQLVSRDFKSKYKRSVFGVFWSFLNPLLTMTVQFLVFSTFFKADTKNYPVYLLSGVVCFSFFSECTTMCLSSISGNYRLITKVYIPKYIFPLSRTISSTVNLGISLIPLLLVTLIMGIGLCPQMLLGLYFLVCLIIFSLGIGLLLSALMVFFRDIQFLWTVLIQIWNYATPIFYPAEIIPDRFKFIVRLNPMYHFIGNFRTCLMSGVSPEPMAYIYCLLFALGSFMLGSYVFKKSQDRFALYL